MFGIATSIGRKLSAIVVVTTIAALALAATALLLVDFRRGLNDARHETQTLTDVIALASAPALSFTDAVAASENLSMLRAKPNVVRAALYDTQGKLFASFRSDPSAPAAFPPRPPGTAVTLDSEYLTAWRPVLSNGEHVGTIWLQVRHEGIAQALSYVGIVLLIMILSLAGALLLSRRLQRAITNPIVEVSDVARGIINGQASHVRAIRRTNDEVGSLVDAFNAMLDDLERRSKSLEESNDALRRSDSRYQLAVRGSSAGLWDWDIAGGTLFIAPRFRALLGYSTDELPDAPSSVAAVLHEEDRSALDAALRAHLRDRTPFQLECRLRDQTGRWRWFYVAGAALWDDQGRAFRMAGSVVEVTERKEAERVLQDSNRTKDEFLATLAHELRNPLAPIRTGLEILRRDKTNGPGSERARATMERQLAHMVRLIDDLLDISRINSGKITLELERVHLRAAVEIAVELSRPAIDAAGHSLEVEFPDEDIELVGDATRLAQALGNVLNNAAKYTPAGGRIAVRVQRVAAVAQIDVQDSGEGIPADMLEDVFKLFTQVRASTRRSQGGLGIGLYLVRSLIELHGGTVVVRSRGEGQGSIFTVRLPCLEPDAPAQLTSGQRDQEGSMEGLKVLLVDDNVDAAHSLAMVLELGGCKTAVLHEGGSVLETAATFGPDVILLDIGLPDVTGYDVAARLRRDPAFLHTPLIAITGWGTEQDRRRSHEAGFDHHLTKPIEFNALEPLLRRVAGVRQ